MNNFYCINKILLIIMTNMNVVDKFSKSNIPIQGRFVRCSGNSLTFWCTNEYPIYKYILHRQKNREENLLKRSKTPNIGILKKHKMTPIICNEECDMDYDFLVDLYDKYN